MLAIAVMAGVWVGFAAMVAAETAKGSSRTTGARFAQIRMAETIVKVGEPRSWPPLQTRARLPVSQTEMLYVGMLRDRLFAYAREHNWQTVAVRQDKDDRRWERWDFLPGGESVLTPFWEQVYARGFFLQVYFESDRLVGLHFQRNPAEPGFNATQLHRLVRAWFPDNPILLRYQVLPEDRTTQVVSAYLGTVPLPFLSDLASVEAPYCQSYLVPDSAGILLVPSPSETAPQCSHLEELSQGLATAKPIGVRADLETSQNSFETRISGILMVLLTNR
jgi:hypothetical protein